MPTNLPAEAKAKLAEYSSARTIEEKVAKLEEAIGLIPDHKGTEKLRRQLRKRLADLRSEMEERRRRRTGGKDEFSVEKEGWAQIAIIGPANSGKSSLLNVLTNAKSPVADYPLSTVRPYPGMMLVRDAEIQLVDLPPVLTVDLQPTGFTSRAVSVARNSDLLLIVLDSTSDPVAQLEVIRSLLEDHGISLKRPSCEVKVQRTDGGGIRLVVLGRLQCRATEVIELMRSYGYSSAVLKVIGDATLDEIEEQVIVQPVYKRSVVALNKSDALGPERARDVARLLAERSGLKVVPTSVHDHLSIEDLKEALFGSLSLIRVYTQKDGVVSNKPLLLPEGSTVLELAEMIHKELARGFRYARVWGRSVKVQGQRVGPDHSLSDGDVVEIKAG
ncbi:MAG: TGS domain-containing protein [Thaumarchaeota archaeon]|nr:TGS domain-containing protein [Candidatus Calditenuaceae archaeon]MDW8187343.1 TGS domain-containing protein [Nitrososphaerota archaeon]